MMKFDEIYRDHRIGYQRGNRVAYIVPIGSIFALEIIPTATTAEGILTLRARA